MRATAGRPGSPLQRRSLLTTKLQSFMHKFFRAPWIAPALLLVVTSAYTIYTLQFRFGGYDLSPLIDVAWRLHSGQTPNNDFICTFPPVLYLGAAAAFRLFGVRWAALSLASVVYTCVITALGLRTLQAIRHKLSAETTRELSWTFAILQLLPLLLIGHPWHSSWTGAATLYALLATFSLALFADTPSALDRELLAHLGFAESLLLLAKPNTALPTLLICTLVLLFRPNRWRNALVPLGAGLLVSSIALLTVHTNLLVTYRMYFRLSSRLGADSGFGDLFADPFVPGGLPDLAVYLAVIPSLLWMLFVVGRNLRHPQQLWICTLALGAIAISILGLGTNVEFRLVDMPCLLFGAALFAAAVPSSAPRMLHGAFAQALFTLLLISFFYAETRARMQAVGQWASASCGSLITQHDPFFGKFHACAPFFSLLSQVDAVHRQYPHARVFFGPRMEFLYARNHIASPKSLPLWWHPGSSFPEPALPRIASAWKQSNFDLLIFLHNDRTRMPAAILDVIQQNYVAVTPTATSASSPDGQIDVYLRR